MAKERVVSLDWLKCLAAILIVNSHIGVCYGKYAALATGGAIGNTIFFFCSGYALSLGRFDRFDNWYKRRLFRLYPSVVARVLIIAPIIAMLTGLFSGEDYNILSVNWLIGGGQKLPLYQLVHGGGWFLQAILLFYAIIYVLRRIFRDKLIWTFPVLIIAAVIIYFVMSQEEVVNLYAAESKYAWFIYFIVMTMGMSLGTVQFNVKKHKTHFWLSASILLVIAYYGIMGVARKLAIPAVEMLSLIPLFLMMYSMMKLFEDGKLRNFWDNKWSWPFRFVSTHCWEIYLAQLFFVFTYNNHFDKVFPFPSNIVVTFCAIFVTGYSIKVTSRLIVQLFNKGDFDWRNIIITW